MIIESMGFLVNFQKAHLHLLFFHLLNSLIFFRKFLLEKVDLSGEIISWFFLSHFLFCVWNLTSFFFFFFWPKKDSSENFFGFDLKALEFLKSVWLSFLVFNFFFLKIRISYFCWLCLVPFDFTKFFLSFSMFLYF